MWSLQRNNIITESVQPFNNFFEDLKLQYVRFNLIQFMRVYSLYRELIT